MSETRGLNLRPEERPVSVCPVCLNIGFFLAGTPLADVRYKRCICASGESWLSFGDDGKLAHPDDVALFLSYGFKIRSVAAKPTARETKGRRDVAESA